MELCEKKINAQKMTLSQQTYIMQKNGNYIKKMELCKLTSRKKNYVKKIKSSKTIKLFQKTFNYVKKKLN